jgi:hypothetical protein
MTYRDPYNPFDDRSLRFDPAYTNAPRDVAWSRGGIVGAIVAIAVVAAIIAYGTSVTSTDTATGPNTTMSEPSTTGQGGGAPAGAPVE